MFFLLMALAACLTAAPCQAKEVKPSALSLKQITLSALSLSGIIQGYGTPGIDRSVAGQPLTIGGKSFASGVGTHAESTVSFDLNPQGANLYNNDGFPASPFRTDA